MTQMRALREKLHITHTHIYTHTLIMYNDVIYKYIHVLIFEIYDEHILILEYLDLQNYINLNI